MGVEQKVENQGIKNWIPPEYTEKEKGDMRFMQRLYGEGRLGKRHLSPDPNFTTVRDLIAQHGVLTPEEEKVLRSELTEEQKGNLFNLRRAVQTGTRTEWLEKQPVK